MNKQIRITEFQAGEIKHKLYIVSTEPDLLESYDLSESEVEDLLGSVPTAGEFTFDPKYTDVLTGEIENCIEIARDNLGNGQDLAYASYISSMRNLLRKIAKAVAA